LIVNVINPKIKRVEINKVLYLFKYIILNKYTMNNMKLKFEELNIMEENFFSQNKVTISVQQRNGRKNITTISGMAEDLDLKKILSYVKKTYNCNGSIVKNDKLGEVIILSGDQKDNMYNFLINEEINKKDEIIIKGV